MSQSFGAAAARLAALAGQGLGWRPAEFWAATPTELALVLGPVRTVPAAPISRRDLEQLMEQDR